MHKPRTRNTFLQALAVALLLAIAPAYAPAQDGAQPTAPAQPGSPQPGAPDTAAAPSVRILPPALPAPGQLAPPSEPAEPIEGEMDPSVIQRVQLDELSLSAIILSEAPAKSIAMLEHNGVGYTVNEGTKIGSRNGVVREITATSVIVEEPGSEPGGPPILVELTLQQ
jgi:hypothetical protein